MYTSVKNFNSYNEKKCKPYDKISHGQAGYNPPGVIEINPKRVAVGLAPLDYEKKPYAVLRRSG